MYISEIIARRRGSETEDSRFESRQGETFSELLNM
jgi:hypothetical protein